MRRRQGERNAVKRRLRWAERMRAKHPTGRKKKVGDCGHARCLMCHANKLLGRPKRCDVVAWDVGDFD